MHEIGRSADKSFAYLLGVYLGDGCVTRQEGRPVFRLNTIDKDFAEAVKAALGQFTSMPVYLHTYAVPKSTKPNHHVSCFDGGICAQLQLLTDRKQKLPLLSSDRAIRLAFIAGLMDSEGFVGATSNPTNRRYYMGFKCCSSWVPQFKELLESLGIRTGKLGIEQPRKPGYLTPQRFHIKMQSWIDAGAYFNIARKQQRVEEWGVAGAYERRAKRPRRLISETIRRTRQTV